MTNRERDAAALSRFFQTFVTAAPDVARINGKLGEITQMARAANATSGLEPADVVTALRAILASARAVVDTLEGALDGR